MINGHRKHIDDVVDLVKQEMSLLNDVDKPGSDVESYVRSLDKVLISKIEMIFEMRK
jgi:kinesin family protein 2/24